MRMEHFPIKGPCFLGDLPTMTVSEEAASIVVQGLATLGCPLRDHLTFCDRTPTRESADTACLSMVLIPRELESVLSQLYPMARLIIVRDPRAVFIDTIQYLKSNNRLVMASTLLPPQPIVSSDVCMGDDVLIEDGVQVDSGVTIKSRAIIRRGTWLKSGVVIGENTVIGCTGSNLYVGSDGVRRRFPHLAGVVVGEGVLVGAQCVIVQGILSSTYIGAGSIIGNLSNVGHGAQIGVDVWISVGVLVGGHAKIAAKTTIGMGCKIRDNISIGVGANVGMGSVVTKNVIEGRSMFGNPAKPYPKINAGPSR